MDIVKLPQLLVLGPLSVFNVYEREFSTKFHILKPYESPLPTEIYMQTHGQPVRAILCSGKSQVTAQLLRLLPSLQLVMAPGTGVNHIDLPECRRLGISVTNTGDVFSEDTADYAVGLLIDVLRKISAGDRHVRRGAWPVHGDYSIGVKVTNFLDLPALCRRQPQYMSPGPCHCDPFCEEAPLLLKLRGYFAEILRESCLMPLGILYLPTYVDFRNRRNDLGTVGERLSEIDMSVKCRLAVSRQKDPMKLHCFLGVCLGLSCAA
ncbi:glyoxylate hydroxypyruvate reductase HPR3-like [Olea europaea subsp. europaea]|uniref:Glyoxylate hydroxypyruvate reductase HPR3-like n=1 Tax=Olea europaea subsp. europaea TaxID=158383 RepID=A0A8S0TNU5_OLEEU|nr:glyoxylate hydroxypyruvate reductase HPR3-like [Olea europaea subsp. europaea]